MGLIDVLNCCYEATPDSSLIEAVMSTEITTTIKITRDILEIKNLELANIYKPLQRCVAVIDDKVEKHFGTKIQTYFDAHDIPLTKVTID